MNDLVFNYQRILIDFLLKTIVLVSLANFNSTFCYTVLPEEFTITYSAYVKVNDSTRITIQNKNGLLDNYQYEWLTDSGTIESSGSEVIFFAPDSAGYSNIKLNIYYQDDLIKSHTFSISVFRQLIILKADDLIYNMTNIISKNWTRFLHYVVSEKIKTGVGLILNSLETDDERYFYLLKYLVKTGYIELWNHGYNHLLNAQDSSGGLYDEFRNKSLVDQKEQLRKAQSIAKEKLGLTLRTFGAPGNAIDSTTIMALDAFDEIKVWFFGLQGSGKLILERSAEMEFPTGNPDYNSFERNYDSSKAYLVFQIHPNQWDESQFDEFKEIISFLRKKRSTFILPYEYYNPVIIQSIN